MWCCGPSFISTLCTVRCRPGQLLMRESGCRHLVSLYEFSGVLYTTRFGYSDGSAALTEAVHGEVAGICAVFGVNKKCMQNLTERDNLRDLNVYKSVILT